MELCAIQPRGKAQYGEPRFCRLAEPRRTSRRLTLAGVNAGTASWRSGNDSCCNLRSASMAFVRSATGRIDRDRSLPAHVGHQHRSRIWLLAILLPALESRRHSARARGRCRHPLWRPGQHQGAQDSGDPFRGSWSPGRLRSTQSSRTLARRRSALAREPAGRGTKDGIVRLALQPWQAGDAGRHPCPPCQQASGHCGRRCQSR